MTALRLSRQRDPGLFMMRIVGDAVGWAWAVLPRSDTASRRTDMFPGRQGWTP